MSKIIRRKTKVIKIGNIFIGGNHPIAIQSMTKTPTTDIEATVRQINDLENAGGDIVRLAVKDNNDVLALRKIKEETKIPLVADIHFNWRLAIGAIDNGVDKIRLNPGNIYEIDQLQEISRAAKSNHVPIRVGVNSGSLRSHKSPVARQRSIADRMVRSALDYIKILEGFKFYDIVVSLKASNVFDTLQAYHKMSKVCDYPLHLGLTATGPSHLGTIKSSIVLGTLLLEGIGDTIRISLTDKPEQEIKIAQYILEATGLRSFAPEIISCPTCGRCEVDLVKIVKKLENTLTNQRTSATKHGGSANIFGGNEPTNQRVKVAIMGCVVNGPGEAKDADIGLAFGRKEGLLFKNGKAIKKVTYEDCINELLNELRG